MRDQRTSVEIFLGDDDAYLAYVDRGKKVIVRPEWRERKNTSIKKDLLSRAILGKRSLPVNVVDATAGFAADAVHLARLGFTVTAIEKDERVASVVAWWLQESKINLNFISGNACEELKKLKNIDVVYLDPMFPEKSGSGAKTRKHMDLLQQIQEPADDIALFKAAMVAASRVVVKRHLKDLSIVMHPRPSYRLDGKLIRYDVYDKVKN